MSKTYGPYTPVRRSGNWLFVSGQIGIDATTKEVKTNIATQTKQVLANLSDVLKTEGAKLDDIVKTTIYLTDMDNFGAMNEEYELHFKVPRPARTTVAVSELPRVGGQTKLLVEIDAVAYLEGL